MKKTRFVALATAAAVTAGGAVPTNAARTPGTTDQAANDNAAALAPQLGLQIPGLG